MKKFAAPHQQQEHVNAYFQSRSLYWADVYRSSDVNAEMYRERHARVLAWIDDLALSPGSQLLEIGCGAVFISIALAQRRLPLHQNPPPPSILQQYQRHPT